MQYDGTCPDKAQRNVTAPPLGGQQNINGADPLPGVAAALNVNRQASDRAHPKPQDVDRNPRQGGL